VQTSKIFSKPYGVLFLKLLILSTAFYTIYSKIQDFQIPIPILPIAAIFLTAGFSIVNWYLEILKWKSLVNTSANISFSTSLNQSLAAHTTAIITPNKIGEYGAKAAFYKRPLRKKIIGLTFIGNSYQMAVTTVFGAIGILRYKHELFHQNTVIIVFISALLAGLVLYSLHKTKNIFSVFQKLTLRTHRTVFLLSFLRYLCFSFQYLFLLYVLGVQHPFLELLPLIWLLYFISSCIPSFALLDFAVKGSVALVLFSHLQIPNTILLTTAFLMWLFNFAIPAIIGGFYISTFQTAKQLHYDTID